jgi:hypothetical protein
MIAEEIDSLLADLPGGERARIGLRDIAQGNRTIESMWLEMARSRFRESGIVLPPSDPEVHLSLHAACLANEKLSGYATYRALNEELSSLLDALEARLRRMRPR